MIINTTVHWLKNHNQVNAFHRSYAHKGKLITPCLAYWKWLYCIRNQVVIGIILWKQCMQLDCTQPQSVFIKNSYEMQGEYLDRRVLSKQKLVNSASDVQMRAWKEDKHLGKSLLIPSSLLGHRCIIIDPYDKIIRCFDQSAPHNLLILRQSTSWDKSIKSMEASISNNYEQ